MNAPVPPAGPPCDLCRDEQPIMSVMNLADYSTVQVGSACLVEFLIGLLAQIGTPVTPVTAPDAPDGSVPAPAAEGPSPAAEGTPTGQSAAAPPKRPRARK